ncbi:hypothetical protein [Clostridium scatologenes]|uniref:Uncharacterized protein n=1 Tax=Clostridium scatologenes TaxID=1548 RepID=A0A0E3M5S7_CLOSL|nr:hypothetical protein [Clostridium scatologenes]AKA68509.1 hypothetical protein CSCA_1384 [Clostridium scatologenes]
MDNKIEIVVFSHVSGKVEKISCEAYELNSNCNMNYVSAISNGNKIVIIPWNRIKQININQ